MIRQVILYTGSCERYTDTEDDGHGSEWPAGVDVSGADDELTVTKFTMGDYAVWYAADPTQWALGYSYEGALMRLAEKQGG